MSVRGRALYSAIALGVVALVVAAGAVFALGRPSSIKYAGMFETAIGVYPGSDVRVLGVSVGAVDWLRPEGRLVRVDFHVDSDVPVPKDAAVVVVAPTVVADRYLQLTPAYSGGPTLAEGSVIPRERTASPAEFDDLLGAVQKLTTSLGPQGVNATGALSDALSTTARNLAGNGQKLNTTLGNLSQAVNTLDTSREDLFGTVRNLQSFVTNLKQDDGQVREFSTQFAQVSQYLAGERENLGAALRELSEALGEVAVFVRDNRAEIRIDVDRLAEILRTVNGERLALEQILDTAPIGLSGLINAYNGASGTLDTRVNILQILVCQVYQLVPPRQPVLGSLLPPSVRAGGASPGRVAAPPVAAPTAGILRQGNPPIPMMFTPLGGGR
jgi:phospholipid/cholesterol/gamma-HCH transport system substrate-binding protein